MDESKLEQVIYFTSLCLAVFYAAPQSRLFSVMFKCILNFSVVFFSTVVLLVICMQIGIRLNVFYRLLSL